MANLKTVANARWQDVVNFLLGGWLFISPWVLGFSDGGPVATSAWVFGIIVAALALSAILAYQTWEEWFAVAIGAWVFISPWVLSAASTPSILWSSVTVGTLLIALALWSSTLEHGPGPLRTRS